MFNKPTLFPKSSPEQASSTASVSPPRGSRLVPGGQAMNGAVSPNDGVSPTRESSLTPMTSVSASSVTAANASSSATPASRPEPEANEPSTAVPGAAHLIVGLNVKLKGAEILDCDTLVVEGTVEAKMDSRVMRIAEGGCFSGVVGIDVAEIRGCFEGELTARSQLIIHATGRVSGKIRYGKIFIEEGGQISGDIKAIEASVASPAASASASAQNLVTANNPGSESSYV